jgi:hypothetical protein
MKLGLHSIILNKKLFLDYFISNKEFKNKEYLFNINKVINSKEFYLLLNKILFKYLILKNIQENNSQLIK